MNSVLQLPASLQAHQRFAAPLWLDTLGWLVACLAVVTVAAAGLPMAAWAGVGDSIMAIAGASFASGV